jgi:hypothetical protein
MFRPIASLAVDPKRRSAAGFQEVILEARSTVEIAVRLSWKSDS